VNYSGYRVIFFIYIYTNSFTLFIFVFLLLYSKNIMMKSMTGFGKSVLELAAKKITITIKSLNSKQFDLRIRLPNIYKEKELDIRSQMLKKLKRGKIDLDISVQNINGSANYSFNKSVAKKYYDELNNFSFEMNISKTSDILSAIVKMPEVLIPEKKELDKNEWIQIQSVIKEASSSLDKSRKQEGEILEKDIINRISLILKLLDNIEAFEKQRIISIKEHIQKKLSEIIEKDRIDQNRLEQEMIYYIEKIDITEEKVRLKKHCEYFLKTLKEPLNGKKLSFISQEIGREINTLGSKANDVDIQQIVVEMKDELEKIKEQLLNIL